MATTAPAFRTMNDMVAADQGISLSPPSIFIEFHGRREIRTPTICGGWGYFLHRLEKSHDPGRRGNVQKRSDFGPKVMRFLLMTLPFKRWFCSTVNVQSSGSGFFEASI